MLRQMKSLPFSFASLLKLLFCCFCCCCCGIGMMNNAVKQLLTIWSWSQFLICHNYEAERSSQEHRNTLTRRENYMLLTNKLKLFVAWKLQCTFRSLFYDQSCALETWKISGISSQFRLLSLIPHGTEALKTSNLL